MTNFEQWFASNTKRMIAVTDDNTYWIYNMYAKLLKEAYEAGRADEYDCLKDYFG